MISGNHLINTDEWIPNSKNVKCVHVVMCVNDGDHRNLIIAVLACKNQSRLNANAMRFRFTKSIFTHTAAEWNESGDWLAVAAFLSTRTQHMHMRQSSRITMAPSPIFHPLPIAKAILGTSSHFPGYPKRGRNRGTEIVFILQKETDNDVAVISNRSYKTLWVSSRNRALVVNDHSHCTHIKSPEYRMTDRE